jgi:hypothetical protein
MNQEPILQPMAYDPFGTVEYFPEEMRDERCGERIAGEFGRACCHRLMRFRACRTVNGVLHATACNRCSLEYDVVARKGEKTVLDQLAVLHRCSREEAFERAKIRFGFIFSGYKPKKERPKSKVRSPIPEET